MASTNVGSIHYDLKLDTSKFDKATQKVGDKLGNLADRMKDTAKRVAQVGAAMGALAVVIGVKTNAELETANLQFETLMGNAEDAKKHVKSLFDFAKRTPFETQPIIDASLKLQTFGGAALNTEDNLLRVGNAAAAVNAGIEEVAFWVGRAYSMIQAGKPFGEAAMRLQELAVLSPQARAEMEKLQESGASSKVVFAALQKELDKFNGAMEKQANTMSGLSSTIMDIIKLDLGFVFEPLFETTKKAMIALIQFAESDAWMDIKKKAHDSVGTVAKFLNQIIDGFESGGLQGALDAFKKQFEELDIGPKINEAIRRIDYARLAMRLINGFASAIMMVNWEQMTGVLTLMLITVLQNVDWVGLVRAVVPILPKVIEGILTGFVMGMWDWFTRDPLNFLMTLASIAFMPVKFVVAIGAALAKVPLLGTLLSWIWKAISFIPQKIGEPLRNLFSNLGHRILDAIRHGFSIGWGAVAGWLHGLGRRISDTVGDLWGVLWNAGKSVIEGLWSGMKSAWNDVSRWLKDRARDIKNLKGPIDKDRTMLLQEGIAVMQGFNQGLLSGYGEVRKTLTGITADVARTPMSGSQQPNVSTSIFGNINIGSEVDSDRFMRRLTRNQELARMGGTAV